MNKLHLAKKGQAMEEMAHIPRVFLLVVLVFVIYGLISLGIKNNADISQAESELILQRILYSTQGISYYDLELQRLYPGTVDLNKFTTRYLESIFSLPNEDQHISARIELKTNDLEIAPVYINEEWFNRWLPLTSFLGKGGKNLATETLPITIIKDNNKIQGILRIEVITPR